MSREKTEGANEFNTIKDSLLTHQQVIGDKLYFRVPRKNGTMEAVPLESKEMLDYMTRYLIDERGFFLNKKTWESVKSYILGGLSSAEFEDKENRIAQHGGAIFYDIHNEYDEQLKYIEIRDGDWEVKSGNTDVFLWNQFSKEQVLPDKEQGDFLLLKKYLNIRTEDMILALVYIATCMVPGIQHPILNVSGEHSTGKSTLSEIIKDLIDPVKGKSLSNFSDGKDGLLMQLSQFYLTTFDNTEKLPLSLNQVFCQVVSGGVTYRRRLYTQDSLVPIEYKSIVILNGITSAIRKPDLLSRAVFVETNPLSNYNDKNKMIKEFKRDLPKIFGGLLTIVAKALQIKSQIKLSKSYRLMEFTKIGYAIAESIGVGLGEEFMKAMERNEKIQLKEMHEDEPLIQVLKNCLSLNPDGVSKPVSKFLEDIVNDYKYHYSLSDEEVHALPKAANALSRKITALKSSLLKMGIIVELESIPSNNYRKLSVYPKSEENETENHLIRKAILGLRKAI